jgi:transposase
MGSVARRPDIYLSELVNDLKEICGVTTSRVSVWRVLRNRGYTHKKVYRFVPHIAHT